MLASRDPLHEWGMACRKEARAVNQYVQKLEKTIRSEQEVNSIFNWKYCNVLSEELHLRV